MDLDKIKQCLPVSHSILYDIPNHRKHAPKIKINCSICKQNIRHHNTFCIRNIETEIKCVICNKGRLDHILF